MCFNRKYYKNKKQQQHQHFFVLLGVNENEILETGRRLSLASSLKTSRERYFLFRKY
jgi:hypothetical protein